MSNDWQPAPRTQPVQPDAGANRTGNARRGPVGKRKPCRVCPAPAMTGSTRCPQHSP